MKPNEEKRSGYVTLEQIVYDFLSETDKGDPDYRKAYSIALKGYREMMLDVAGKVSTKLITVLANKTARLPLDYSNWIRIGVLNELGEIATLTNNEQLTSFEQCCDDRGTNPDIALYNNDPWTDFDSFLLNGRYPYWTRASLGIGSLNNIGEFKINKVDGYIIFSPAFQYANVVMEYMADPSYSDGEYIVDVNIEEAVLAYLIWVWNRTRKDVSSYDKRSYRAEYYNQKRLARQRMNPLRAQDISDSFKKFVKEAPRN